LLTIVAVFFSGLLLFLVFAASATGVVIALLIFLAILCYTSLELLIKKKRYYNAGVDNVLMILAIVFMVSSFFVLDFKVSPLVVSGVIMAIAFWLSLRFTDAFMAQVFYCCFFVFVFLVYIQLGNIAKSTAPFIMMALSAFVYIVVKKLINSTTFMYRFCFKAVIVLTLITFYASGNYFVVRELGNQIVGFETASNGTGFPGWLFWILTLIVPPTYIIYGIIKKDRLVMRTGLGLIAASVFTIKYYYSILPVEIEMFVAGILLIALSYLLIKYLATPKFGFASYDLYPGKKDLLNIEALIIAETFNKQPASIDSHGLYEGGSGGGGGATGKF